MDEFLDPKPTEWGDGLSRLVVTAAIYSNLLEALPGAFTPDLFGDSRSPRWHIAKAVCAYVEQYGTRPTASIVDELVRVEMKSLSETQQEAISQEWQYVQDASDDIPDDPTYVYDQVRKWIDYRRLEQALMDGASALGKKGVDGLDDARELLAKAMPTPTAPAAAEGRLELVDAADLVLEPLRPVPWVLKPLFTQDMLAELTSYPGDGKTTLTYPMLIEISRGRPFLGMPAKKTKVMILGVEESRRAIIARLRRFGVSQQDRGQIFVHPKSLTASPGTYRDLIAAIEAKGIGMLVIDTISQFWTVVNENDNSEVKTAMRELLKLAHERDVLVLVLHHDGKGDGKKSRGASSLPASVDLHLAMARVKGAAKDDPRRVITIEKKREEETPWSDINLTFNGLVWTYTSDLPPRETPADQVVAAVQGSANPMSSSDIAEATGLSGGSLKRAILEAGERLTSSGKGPARRYTTTNRTNSQEVASGPIGPIDEKANDDND